MAFPSLLFHLVSSPPSQLRQLEAQEQQGVGFFVVLTFSPAILPSVLWFPAMLSWLCCLFCLFCLFCLSLETGSPQIVRSGICFMDPVARGYCIQLLIPTTHSPLCWLQLCPGPVILGWEVSALLCVGFIVKGPPRGADVQVLTCCLSFSRAQALGRATKPYLSCYSWSLLW